MGTPSLGFFCTDLRPAQLMAADHAHSDVEWNYLASGNFLYRWCGRQVELPPRRLVLLWGALPHRALRCSADSRLLVGVLPLARFLAWRPPRHGLLRLQSGNWVLGPDDDSGDDLRCLEAWCRDLARGGAWREQVELEARARFRRMLLTESVVPVPASDPQAAALVAELIERHAEPGLRIEDLAGPLGRQARIAAVRRHTGETPGRFLRAYRVGEAQRLLQEGLSAAAAGRGAGFGSIAAFYAAFRALTGLSPAAWLRQHDRVP
jgi:AraC-like DNA-binding protein